MIGVVQKHKGPGKISSLILECVCTQPLVKVLHAAAETTDVVLVHQALDTRSIDPLEPMGSAGLDNQLLWLTDRPVRRSKETVMILVGQADRSMGLHQIGSIRQRSIQEELGDGDTRQPRSLGRQVIIVR
jgi:hypothetical protein